MYVWIMPGMAVKHVPRMHRCEPAMELL